jgi:hypothetical protein
MSSKLLSFTHQCLNAIATTFLRRAFAGAIRAQRPFRRSPHTILSAARGSQGAPFARPYSTEAGAL